MIERKYLCTYDLFSSIPTLDGSRKVTGEIFAWNKMMKTSSKSRLVRDGRPLIAPDFGLSERHILTIERLAIEPEVLLGRSTIADHFDPAFFRTNFWFMWCTTFAFQPWHGAVEFKRYLVRFAHHMVSGFSRLEGIMRTIYNQYDSMVRPLHKWLDERGVVFVLGTEVIDLRFDGAQEAETVKTMVCRSGRDDRYISVIPQDSLLVTLGSMTEASSLGAMDRAPILKDRTDGGAWNLWETLSDGRPQFGRPSVFSEHVDQSKWVSFTITLHDPTFLRILLDVTGNVPGEGASSTFRSRIGWSRSSPRISPTLSGNSKT